MTLPEITAEEIIEEAWHRYETEPIFHARVYKAASAIKTEIRNTGMPWSRSFDGVLTAAAATGLLMAEIHDPETGDFIEFRRETTRDQTGGERVAGAEPTDTDALNGHDPADPDQHQDPGSSTEVGEVD